MSGCVTFHSRECSFLTNLKIHLVRVIFSCALNSKKKRERKAQGGIKLLQHSRCSPMDSKYAPWAPHSNKIKGSRVSPWPWTLLCDGVRVGSDPVLPDQGHLGSQAWGPSPWHPVMGYSVADCTVGLDSPETLGISEL